MISIWQYSLLFIIYSLLTLKLCRTAGWVGSTYQDLVGSTYTAFAAEASAWSHSAIIDPSPVSFCSTAYLLGGFNVLAGSVTQDNGYFSRTYSGLNAIAHNALNIMITVQGIDSFDGNDHFSVQADSAIFDNLNFNGASGGYLCGHPGFTDQLPMKVKLDIPHSIDTLTLTITSHLSQPSNDESFGFREIQITPYMATTAVTAQLCGMATVSISGDPAIPPNICKCSSPKFYESPPSSGTCYPCHSDCDSCFGNGANQCLSCRAGKYLTGTSCADCHYTCAQCTASGPDACKRCYENTYYSGATTPEGWFLAPNAPNPGTYCIPTCPDPLTKTSNGTMQSCGSPCHPDYTLWDKTCSTTCAYPLVPDLTHPPFKICTYPCQPYNFLYWDQSCVIQCNFPLQQNIQNSRQFCLFPCADQTNYLYWYGFCDANCPFPLQQRTGHSRKFCDYPCAANEYLYWNGSCLSTCDTPLKIRPGAGNATYCDFPCATTNQAAYWDGSCDLTCPAPLTLKSEGSPMIRYFCNFQCKIDEFLYWNGSCSSSCPPPLQDMYDKSRSFCLFPCTSTQYLLYDGTCVSSCPSPLSPRIEPGAKYCDQPCPSSQYLFWNGSCSSNCNPPLLKRIQGSSMFCDFPCGTTTDYLYWDGTCLPTCPAPLTSKIEGASPRKFCEYGCNSTNGEYLYFNGSCSKTCSSPPFSVRVKDGLRYCDYPCTGVSPSIYLYWDGSCQATCDAPRQVRIDGTAKFCGSGCESPNQYVYWNGTCSEYCASPLTQRVEGSGSNVMKFCDFGCATGEYLYWNGSCKTQCVSPLRERIEGVNKFCVPPCDSVFDYYYPDRKTCQRDCSSPYLVNEGLTYARCLSPDAVEEEDWFVSNILTASQSNQVSLIAVVKMSEYLRYLNIQMPPRLQQLAISKGRSVFSLKFGFDMPIQVAQDFINSTLPTMFQKHGFHSSFTVNFWKDLTSIGIMMSVALIITILENSFQIYKSAAWQSLFRILKRIFRWNCLILLISTCLDDVILFSYLQFRTFHLSRQSQYTIASFIQCLITVIIAFAYPFGIFYTIYQSHSVDSQLSKRITTNRHQTFHNRFQACQVFFSGIRTDSLFKHSFYLIYLLRLCIPMMIACYLSKYPLAQMVLQTLICVSIIPYIILIKPFQKKINQIQILTFEAIALIIDICLLILTIFDVNGKEISDFAIFLGDAVIFLTFCTNVLGIGFLFTKILQEASAIRKKNGTSSTILTKISYVQLLALPFQQGGMGFEEMIERSKYLDQTTSKNDSEMSVTDQTESSPRKAKTQEFVPLPNENDTIIVREITEHEFLRKSTLTSNPDEFIPYKPTTIKIEENPSKKRKVSNNVMLDDISINKTRINQANNSYFETSSIQKVDKKNSFEASMQSIPDSFRKNSEL